MKAWLKSAWNHLRVPHRPGESDTPLSRAGAQRVQQQLDEGVETRPKVVAMFTRHGGSASLLDVNNGEILLDVENAGAAADFWAALTIPGQFLLTNAEGIRATSVLNGLSVPNGGKFAIRVARLWNQRTGLVVWAVPYCDLHAGPVAWHSTGFGPKEAVEPEFTVEVAITTNFERTDVILRRRLRIKGYHARDEDTGEDII